MQIDVVLGICLCIGMYLNNGMRLDIFLTIYFPQVSPRLNTYVIAASTENGCCMHVYNRRMSREI